jgi:hypothetical protein
VCSSSSESPIHNKPKSLAINLLITPLPTKTNSVIIIYFLLSLSLWVIDNLLLSAMELQVTLVLARAEKTKKMMQIHP